MRGAFAGALFLGLLSLMGCTVARVDVPASDRLAAYSAEPYAQVLDAAVVEGDVAYGRIVGATREALSVYLDALARFGPESTPAMFPTPADRFAYHLNAYNAFMLRLWLDEGAAEADADATVGWTTWFFVKRFPMDGQVVTLHELEQSIIRPAYGDARLHAALVCGAISCPPLRVEPFIGGRLESQLDDQMVAWLHDPQDDGVSVSDDGEVAFSRIFKWYRGDFREHVFGDAGAGLAGMIEHYLDDGDTRKAKILEAVRSDSFRYQGYDWTINLARPSGSAR